MNTTVLPPTLPPSKGELRQHHKFWGFSRKLNDGDLVNLLRDGTQIVSNFTIWTFVTKSSDTEAVWNLGNAYKSTDFFTQSQGARKRRHANDDSDAVTMLVRNSVPIEHWLDADFGSFSISPFCFGITHPFSILRTVKFRDILNEQSSPYAMQRTDADEITDHFRALLPKYAVPGNLTTEGFRRVRKDAHKPSLQGDSPMAKRYLLNAITEKMSKTTGKPNLDQVFEDVTENLTNFAYLDPSKAYFYPELNDNSDGTLSFLHYLNP